MFQESISFQAAAEFADLFGCEFGDGAELPGG